MNSFNTEVDQYLQKLRHPLSDAVNALRHIILSTSESISEQIKWNSPAYYFNGNMEIFDAKEYKRDLVVFHLRKPDHILLVFPTGSLIQDPTGLLGGNFSDTRKTIRFENLEQVKEHAENIQLIITKWLQLTS